MIIGQIITDSIINDTLEYFNITTDVSKCIGSDIPVLIIGKKLAQSIYGDGKIKVLDHKIEDNIYWTYSKFEKRNEYEKDMFKFTKLCIKNINESVSYQFMDLFLTSGKTMEGFKKFLEGKWKKIIYVTDKHLYIYYNKTVYGISLIQAEYMDIKNDKFISSLKENPNNIVINNDNFIPKELKNNFIFSKIIIPYLYFIDQNS